MLAQARAEGNIPDVLLLLQHPAVFTIGRFRGQEDIVIDRETMAREGIEVIPTSRGGSITYHGPGQLVGYPIINLKESGIGIREYIWKLEEAVIRLLSMLGIRGHRTQDYPGSVWMGRKKICSIGIKVNRHITMHGLALNVYNDLRYFKFINPCGMKDKEMTSIAELNGYPVSMGPVVRYLAQCFAAEFGMELKPGDGIWQTIPGVPTG
jgi:lipoate-protein ligase B